MPTSHATGRREVLLASVLTAVSARRALAQAPVADDPWPSLAQQIFAGHALADGNDLVDITLPYRAEDAALVPISIRNRIPPDDPRRLRQITLVIDQNPSPVA